MFIIDNAHKRRLLAVSHSFVCVPGSKLVPQMSGHPGCTSGSSSCDSPARTVCPVDGSHVPFSVRFFCKRESFKETLVSALKVEK